MMRVLTWCVLPSLICLLAFLQLRHLENFTLEEFISDIKMNGVMWRLIFSVIVWPSFIIVIVIAAIMAITEKLNISKPKWLNAKFLIKEINIVQNGK